MEAHWHLIALHHIPGVGWKTIARLIENGWIPGEKLSLTMYERLKQLGTPQPVIERIKRMNHLSFIKQIQQACEEKNIIPITYFDSRYPPLLKEIHQPPWVLYVKGDPSLLTTPCLAVVGTRKPSYYGMSITRTFSSRLTNHGLTIVSGMAYGIDAQAHRSVLEQHGKTIAVLASGVDVVYPKRHQQLYEQIIEKGAVVSESPPGTQPKPGLFPLRNRIISGLSLGTLVVEAAKRSGSLITADASLEQGREVFAIPGPISSVQSEGTLQLIQEGAKCVKKAEDVLEELPPLPIQNNSSNQRKFEEKLNTVERTLLSYIGDQPIQLAFLLEKLSGKLTVGQVHQALLSLELKRLITQVAGQNYVRQNCE